MLVPAIINV